MDPDPRKEIEVDPDPDLGKEIEVDPDPDLDPERGLKWIRIRPNAVDPGGSGSGSETLFERKIQLGVYFPPDHFHSLTTQP